jgi:hypothetical protein
MSSRSREDVGAIQAVAMMSSANPPSAGQPYIILGRGAGDEIGRGGALQKASTIAGSSPPFAAFSRSMSRHSTCGIGSR